jgi:acetylornithine deacetylase/succinyl-diaminopimelate desuccinylase-like protein
MAFNPNHALIQLLSKVRDDSGKITIPGFYDDVIAISEEDKSKLSFNFDAKEYEKSFGAKPTGGERTLHPLERKWLRPTLEINGIIGGYTGDGVKTVIPAKASAKITCRLVPYQEPEKIGKLVADFLEANAPEGTKATAHVHPGGGPSVRANINSPAVQAYAKAYQEVFGKPCQFTFSGASIPITAELAKASESEIVLVGMGLPDDCIHAPNEHFGLDRIEMGFLATARVLQLLKKGGK